MKTEWLRREVTQFAPYVVAPVHETHVINANENYANVLNIPEVRAAAEEILAGFRPQVYPDPMANGLRTALADYLDVQPEQLLAGNGGDEMISYTLHTFLNEGDTILVHAPTFDMYEVGASLIGAKVEHLPDLPGFRRDQEGILRTIREKQPKMTFLCNPNNPTGELLPASFIEECLKAADNLVFVDEAYMEFAGAESVVPLIDRYPNLIVLRTLSKAFGLAGLRCGYIAADKDIITEVAKVKNPYNLNSLTQALAAAVVRCRDKILPIRDGIVAERERLYEALKQIPGVTVWPSRTNFLLMQVDESLSDTLFDAWKQADILVKRYQGRALLPGAFRLTVTTAEVDDAALRVLKGVMARA